MPDFHDTRLDSATETTRFRCDDGRVLSVHEDDDEDDDEDEGGQDDGGRDEDEEHEDGDGDGDDESCLPPGWSD